MLFHSGFQGSSGSSTVGEAVGDGIVGDAVGDGTVGEPVGCLASNA